MNEGLLEQDLEDRLDTLQAERDLEIELSQQTMGIDRAKREFLIQEDQKDRAIEHRKKLIR